MCSKQWINKSALTSNSEENFAPILLICSRTQIEKGQILVEMSGLITRMLMAAQRQMVAQWAIKSLKLDKIHLLIRMF